MDKKEPPEGRRQSVAMPEGGVRFDEGLTEEAALPKGVSPHRIWGAFRYGVIGSLLTSPPEPGKLGEALEALAQKRWKHPITGEKRHFASSTIEAWYYKAKEETQDPLASLGRKRRQDHGLQRALGDTLKEWLQKQYENHPWWTVELHHKNLLSSLRKQDPGAHPPSYSTLLRYMRLAGLKKMPRPRVNEQGELEGSPPSDTREVALFEAPFVNQLWSLDFHHGKLRVLAPDGKWLQPIVAAILDHHSRLICHLSWGLFETTAELVKCYSEAVMKRGRPRESLSDNGGAMTSGEFRQGLARLGITPKWIRPRTPRHNGKTECFWSALESNLVDMVRGQDGLTLAALNKVSQAWVEIGYNRQVHRETKARPIDRFIAGRNVGLPAVDETALRQAFRIEEQRRPRASDGTIRISGVPFRLPERFRHQSEVSVRYARWDLGFVHLVDRVTGLTLERIFPVDKEANATGERRPLASPVSVSSAKTRKSLPPLLQEQLNAYEQLTGIPLGFREKDK